jgi:acyl carrier protein
MKKKEILSMINNVVNQALDREIVITEKTHLIEEEILDSLDSAMFLIKLEQNSAKEISDKQVAENDLFKVSNLIHFLCE